MERIDVSTIAEAKLEAPGGASEGISLPSVYIRQQARRELTQTIADWIEDKPQAPDPDQLALIQ